VQLGIQATFFINTVFIRPYMQLACNHYIFSCITLTMVLHKGEWTSHESV